MNSSRRLWQLQQVLCRQRTRYSTCNPQKVFQVSPDKSLFDQRVHIELQGLPSQSKITVHAQTESIWQRKVIQFGSCGHYMTSDTGHVDVEKDASLGGTYTGVEPMGLFWSMKPNPWGPQNICLLIRNVETPVKYKLSIYNGHRSLGDLFHSQIQDQALCTTTVQRHILGAGVRRIPVREGRLRGILFLPPGKGPFPGLVDLVGIMGGPLESRAALLASHGFAAYALPYYRYEDLPQQIEDQTFDYFECAAEWFGSHPSVAPGGIGVIGSSGGACFGLMMAYRCPQVKAFVRINGQYFHKVMATNDPEDKGWRPNLLTFCDRSKCTMTDEGLVIKDSWMEEDDKLLPLWKKDVHTLALVSDDDEDMHPWKTDQIQQMYPEERRHLFEVVHYPGAGHLLEPPYTPLCRACYNPFFDTDLVWGGQVQAHAAAQEDSWNRTHQFFRKHLPSVN